MSVKHRWRSTEPLALDTYRVCGHCHHAYPTPDSVLAAERTAVVHTNVLWGEWVALDGTDAFPWWPVRPRLTLDEITYCPLCMTDW